MIEFAKVEWYINIVNQRETDSAIIRFLPAPDFKRYVRLNSHQYVANILVINHPKHLENNGRVFLFIFEQSVKDKIDDAGNPEVSKITGLPVFDAFDVRTGANFRLRAFGYEDDDPDELGIDYQKSTFDLAAPVGDDAYIFDLKTKTMMMDDLLM
jgi:hypothetical protein